MRQRLALWIAIMAALVCGYWVYHCLSQDEEVASKVEWSVVQAVQSQESKSAKVKFVKMESYSLVGIPVQDSRKQVWILLNPRTPPYYKQLPKGTYTISNEDLKRILAFGAVSSTVENCLESHVQDFE